MGFLSSFLMHPGMLMLGGLAVAIPIIIHLLNRRRFKEIEWAAMDFLLEAEQKNRRRVRLEHLILLLLRCLTMLLIGMLIARPFLPARFSAIMFDTQQFERIILLDDSLSTQTLEGNRPAFELAQEQLVDWVQSLSTNETDDRITLLPMSDPTQPIVAAKPVNAENVQEWIDLINELRPTDLAVDLSEGLRELDRYVGAPRQDVNRVVYVMSDLLNRDWKPSEQGAEDAAPHQLLNTLAEKVAGCFLVDIGTDQIGNLSIDAIRPSEVFLSGVSNRMDLTVTNHGPRELQQLAVELVVGGGLPIREILDSLPAGESREVSLPITLGDDIRPSEDSADESQQLPLPLSVPMTVRLLDPQQEFDALPADSQAYFAARVLPGIPVLIVDGDPSTDPLKSESIFLQRAMQPPGELASGNLVDVVNYLDLDNVNLTPYRVVALCNVDQLTPMSLEAIERWVRQGGGLAIFPGSETRAASFNEQLYAAGNGLSPFQVDQISGDIEQQQWASLEVSEQPHQVLRVFEGEDNPFLERVKLFNYWTTRVAEPLPESVNVLARLNDADNTVAIAEKRLGDGRVIAFNVPADSDWTNWPAEGVSYLIMALDLSAYLSGNLSDTGSVQVGQPLVQLADLTLFQRQATLLGPDGERYPLTVQPLNAQSSAPNTSADSTDDSTDDTDLAGDNPSTNNPATTGNQPNSPDSNDSQQQALWQFQFPKTTNTGLYTLQLATTDDQPLTLQFAANADPTEGNLQRLDQQQARQAMFAEQVQLIGSENLSNQSIEGGRREFWRWLIFALLGVLLTEQSLARWFRSRQ